MSRSSLLCTFRRQSSDFHRRDRKKVIPKILWVTCAEPVDCATKCSDIMWVQPNI